MGRHFGPETCAPARHLWPGRLVTQGVTCVDNSPRSQDLDLAPSFWFRKDRRKAGKPQIEVTGGMVSYAIPHMRTTFFFSGHRAISIALI
jgi:hypothetical protein